MRLKEKIKENQLRGKRGNAKASVLKMPRRHSTLEVLRAGRHCDANLAANTETCNETYGGRICVTEMIPASKND